MKFVKVTYLVDCKGDYGALLDALALPKNRDGVTFVLDGKKFSASVIEAMPSDGDVDMTIVTDSYRMALKQKILKEYLAKVLAGKESLETLLERLAKVEVELQNVKSEKLYIQRHLNEVKTKISNRGKKKPWTMK